MLLFAVSLPPKWDCGPPEDREPVIWMSQHKAELELSGGSYWLRVCFLLLYFYYLIEWDFAGHKLCPWSQGTLGTYINLGHMGLIYLLFQHTELAVLSITQSDSLLKMQCFCILWLCSLSDDLLEAVEWYQKRRTCHALSTFGTELENSMRTRIPFVIFKKNNVVPLLKAQRSTVLLFTLRIIAMEWEGESFPEGVICQGRPVVILLFSRFIPRPSGSNVSETIWMSVWEPG